MQKLSSLNYLKSILLMTAVVILMPSCEKPAGFGGTSTISGKIITLSYNEDYSLLIKEAPAVDEDVFLVFSDNATIGDKVSTGPEGNFEFTFLRPGNYTVYFMSEDSATKETDEDVVSFEIELSAGEDKDLGLIEEYKTLEFDDGYASISGVVKLTNYKNSSQYPFLEVKDVSFAQDYEVYLIYNGHEYYDERIRTSYDGVFEFSNLIPGDYKIFTYSEDVTGATEKITVMKSVTITELDEEIELGEFSVEQL